MLLTDWGYDGSNHFGALSDGGGVNTGQFLILGVILLVVWFLLTAMMGYYFAQFVKTKSDHKLYGRTMLWTNLGLCIVELLFAVLTLAFWGAGNKIFKGNADHNYSALVAMVVLGFIVLAATIVVMWVFLPQYGIAFDGKRILFMGEDIQYKTITKIIIDDKTGDTYINYTRGKRTHKKLRFSATSAFGLFIRENSALTGHTAEPGDEKEYFQSLQQADRQAETQFNKEVNNKLQNKDARTTSKPATKKTDSSKSKKK